MATARTYGQLKTVVATICQDTTTSGKSAAGLAINEVIKQIQMEIDEPGLIVGEDSLTTISITAGSTGTVEYSLASAVSSIVDVWYVISGVAIKLLEITSQDDWLKKTAMQVSGTPIYFLFIPQSGATAPKIMVWPAPNSSFISMATNLKYSYIQQLAIFLNDGSDDSSIPAIPYSQDKVLVSGGVFYTATMQSDESLEKVYGTIFANDLANLRAWYSSKRFTESVGLKPTEPLGQPTGYGTVSRDYGRLV